jgi:hypothetical protein
VSDAQTRLVELHGALVLVGEVRVGSVQDVFADAGGERIVGFEIASADGRHWFLPWAASSFESGILRSASTLPFVSGDHLGFYERHGIRLLPDDFSALTVDAQGRVVRSTETTNGGVLARTHEGISDA